ncbi:MAG: CoA transferase, partial [Gammaproteobacteria bacterium]|nr:CoA transferase [Gammaproteobacteria bacterium]
PGERKVNAEGLHDQISVSVSARTAREWEEILAMHGVPAARVRTLPEVLSENQFRHRGQWQEMKMPGINRPAYVPAVGFKADGESTGPSHPPPRLGQDTDEVLASMGITAGQISALRGQGVV